jgi:hypothetical protein
MCRQRFKAVPRKSESRRPGALGIIKQCGAGLFNRRFCEVAGIGEPKVKLKLGPKLEPGACRRDLAGLWFHAIACPQG